MLRKLILASTLGLLGVIAVAMVQAQDPQPEGSAASRSLRAELQAVGDSVVAQYGSESNLVAPEQASLSDRQPAPPAEIPSLGASQPAPLGRVAQVPGQRSILRRPGPRSGGTLNPASQPPGTTIPRLSPPPTGATGSAGVYTPSDSGSSRRTRLSPPQAPPSDYRNSTPPPTSLAPQSLSSGAPAARMAVAPKGAGISERSSSQLLDGQSPALKVTASGPKSVIIGKERVYTIEITNQSTIAADDVLIRIGLPASVRVVANQASIGVAKSQAEALGAAPQLTWQIQQLAPRAQEQLTLKLIATEARPFAVSLDWSCRPQTIQAEVEVLEPKLEMNIAGPSDVLYGETKVYTISITNPGTGDAEGVKINLGGAGVKQLGTIQAGDRKELEVELAAREAGTMSLNAVAVAEGGLRDAAEFKIQVRRAALAVQVVGPPRKYAGSAATYKVVVSNTGDALAEDVMASFRLPEGARYLTGITGAQIGAGSVQWPVGIINPGTKKEFDVSCSLSIAGSNELVAQLQGAGELTAMGSFATQVEALADLKLVVNDPKGPLPVGQEVLYEVVVVNRGSKAAHKINVVGQFSKGIEPIRTEGGSAKIIPGQVIYDPIERIAPGEQVTLRIAAKAESDGNHVFRVEVRCVDPESRLVSEETTRYLAEGLLDIRQR